MKYKDIQIGQRWKFDSGFHNCIVEIKFKESNFCETQVLWSGKKYDDLSLDNSFNVGDNKKVFQKSFEENQYWTYLIGQDKPL
jgi:hypothetical protein